MSPRVTSGRPRRLLGPTVAAAVVFAVFALMLWGAALWVSWASDCPRGFRLNEGLDQSIRVWPPAAECTGGTGDATFWHEALPWATWLIGALVVVAAAILLFGLMVAIRDLRRPTPSSASSFPPLPETSLPRGGPAGGNSPMRRDVNADERDSSAMAA
jgi:hypothetical protein